MSAPLVVNTKDGICWTRRTVTSGGIALYAPESVRTCPDFVMATEAELAERGIVGSAYALPMPVREEPQEDPVAAGRRLDLLSLMDEHAASVVSPVLAAVLDEAERLRARVAELEARIVELGATPERPAPYVATPEAHAQMRESLTRYFAGETEPEGGDAR
jgi:hypothetical protein